MQTSNPVEPVARDGRSRASRPGRPRAVAAAATAVRGLACAAVLLAAACQGGSGGGGAAAGQATGSQTAPPASAGPPLRAGAAAVDVTPTNGAPLGGFGGQPRRVIDWVTIPLHLLAVGGSCFDPDPRDAATFFAPAQGAHDPVMARALVLECGGVKAAIVKVDTIGISGRFRRETEAIAATLGIAREHLLLAATHTHSGPGAVSEQPIWQLVAMDCLNDQTFRGMMAGVEAALRRADAALAPAALGVGAGTETRASRNRRGRPGVFDPEVHVIKVVAEATGAPIAAVVNFAVHGTCLGESNMLFSADLMGACERALENRLGGGVAMFVNGAEGDVSPTHGGFQGAQTVGDFIAETAHQVWGQTAVKASIEIRGAYEDRAMPPPALNATCLPIPGTSDTLCDFLPGFTISVPLVLLSMPTTLPFQALRLDDAVLAAVPGEAITEIGLDIKNAGRARGFGHTLVAGLANEHAGYITTFAEYSRGHYEGQATLYGPTTGQVVVDHVTQMLDRVR